MVRFNWVTAFIVACIIGTFTPEAVQAQNHNCTMAEGRTALDEAVMLRSWDALYRSYRKFRYCDDGAIAEGYSESVARILVDRWSTLPRLAELAAKDAAFRAFVIRHVDATLNTDDLERVEKKTTTSCPPNLRETCKALAIKAEHALKEP